MRGGGGAVYPTHVASHTHAHTHTHTWSPSTLLPLLVDSPSLSLLSSSRMASVITPPGSRLASLKLSLLSGGEVKGRGRVRRGRKEGGKERRFSNNGEWIPQCASRGTLTHLKAVAGEV